MQISSAFFFERVLNNRGRFKIQRVGAHGNRVKNALSEAGSGRVFSSDSTVLM